MQHYTFEIDDETSYLCTITKPFGLYKYKLSPMVFPSLPGIVQDIMDLMLRNIK